MTHISHDPPFFPLWTVVHLFINLISVQIRGGSLTVCVSFREDRLCCSQRCQNSLTNNSRWRPSKFNTKLKVWIWVHPKINVVYSTSCHSWRIFCHFFFYIISLSSSKLTKKQHKTIMKVHIDSFVWETHWNLSHYLLKINFAFMGKVAMFDSWMNWIFFWWISWYKTILNDSFRNLIGVFKLNSMTQNDYW